MPAPMFSGREKDMDTNNPANLLREGIEEIGFEFAESQINSFLAYLSELKRWNRAYNLTALKTDREIIIKHFLDSLLFAKALPENISSLADIGSGAGFPGLPIKIIYPGLSVFLVEPTQKKTAFLRHICSRLRLVDIEVIDKRIEDLKDIKVDLAVTRALFSVGEFIKKTKTILNQKGFLMLSKGPGLEKELEGLDRSRISINDIKLPFEESIRHIVTVGP
jgi:16S rRNA (guanine527-N7)-methyltransferase